MLLWISVNEVCSAHDARRSLFSYVTGTLMPLFTDNPIHFLNHPLQLKTTIQFY